MRVIFFGTGAFAVPSLEQLAARGHAIVACVTQPDRPQGRGLTPQPSPVKHAAMRLRLAVAQPERLQRAPFERLAPALGVAADYGQLIRRDVLALPPHGVLGVHPSLLPKYRGAAPVQWALLNGETTTGVTVYRLDERMDAGEILCQRAVAIEPSEDAAALTQRLARVGAEELLRAIELIASGRATFTPQEESCASLAPKLTKAQGRIDWRASAEAIGRLVRAMAPWPGAVTTWQGRMLKLWAVSVTGAGEADGDVEPGTVVHVSDEVMRIATSCGTVAVTALQLAGGRRMPIRDFLIGHPVRVGEKFGST